MKRKSRLFSDVAIVIIGLALLGSSVYLLIDRIAFFNHSIKTEGEVIGTVSKGSSSKTSYYPIISFQAADANTYKFTAGIGTSYGSYYDGEKLMVRYIEEAPQIAKIDSFMELWGLPAVLLFVGVLLLLGGIILVYKHFNKIRLSKELLNTGRRLQLNGQVKTKYSKDKTTFVVVFDWLNPKDSKTHTFTSDEIAFDPTPYITDRLINVWIDPNFPKKKHYIDLSFLPEKA